MIRIPVQSVLLGSLLLLAACDNTIDPFVESDERVFAITGFLDMGVDTQRVRIAPIRPGDDLQPVLPSSVVASKLSVNDAIAWTRTPGPLDNGSTGLVFTAHFVPDAGAVYALEVRAAGLPPLRAFTQLPPAPTIQIDAPSVSGDQLSQRLTWSEISEPSDVRVFYHVLVGDNRERAEIDVVYDRRTFSTPGNELHVIVPYDRDIVFIRQEILERYGAVDVRLDHLRMRVRIRSREWENPSSAANIENGEGFFASVGEFATEWMLPDTLAQHVGFAPSP